MYAILDSFFFVFHAAWIVFVVTGWIWKNTRRFHLFVVAVTLLSWFGLGLFYGIGYCPSTDWQWQVKSARGETGLPNSYVKYYVDHLTGLSWNPRLVDATVFLIAVAALGLSISLNCRDRRKSVSQKGNSIE